MKEAAKRVLVITYLYPPAARLPSFRISGITEGFLQNNFDVSVLTVDPKYYAATDDTFSELLDKVSLTRVKAPRNPTLLKPWLMFRFYKEARRLLRQEKISLLYFNGSPFYYFILSRLLHWRHSVPYVLDFRDPWYLRPENRSLKKLYIKYLEKWSVAKASLIINVTPQATGYYKNHYSKIDPDRFITIENGFFLKYYERYGSRKKQKNKTLRMIHPGKLLYRDPRPLLLLLKKIIDTGLQNVEFCHIGETEPALEKAIDELGLREYYRHQGAMPYDRALDEVFASDLGIVITAGNDWEPTTKIYDYLCCKTPVLAFATQQGYVADVIQKTDSGILFDEKHIDRTVEEVVAILKKTKKFSFRNVSDFARENQVKKLMKKIKSLQL